MNELNDLQDWYAAQCDGEWEHSHGVKIESCDNPGWWVKIDLKRTALEEVPFSAIQEGDSHPTNPQGEWMRCYVQDHIFHGAGDPAKLQKVLHIFLDWAKRYKQS